MRRLRPLLRVVLLSPLVLATVARPAVDVASRYSNLSLSLGFWH